MKKTKTFGENKNTDEVKALTGTHCSHLYFKFGNAYFQAAIQKSIHEEECIISGKL